MERNIAIYDLNPSLRELYCNRVWDNYIRAPEEYRTLASGPGMTTLGNVFYNRSNEFHTFLRNRSNYIGANTFPSLEYSQLSEEQLSQVSSQLSALEHQAGLSRTYLETNEPLKLRAALQRLDDILAGYSNPITGLPLQPVCSPRYKLIVYDTFKRVHNTSLVDTAREILLDPREDPSLRVVAAEYLKEYDRDMFLQHTYGLIDDARISGYYIEGQQCSPAAEIFFEQEILDIMAEVVQEVKEEQKSGMGQNSE